MILPCFKKSIILAKTLIRPNVWPLKVFFRNFKHSTLVMANSKYQYVRSFEMEDKLEPKQWIAIHLKYINTEHFLDYNCNVQMKLHNAMTVAAKTVMKEIKDIELCYGYGNSFHFIFSKQCVLYKRRGFKLLTNVSSSFCSSYVLNCKDFFDTKLETFSLPIFEGEIYLLPEDQCLREYLTYQQYKCHLKNLHFVALKNLSDKAKFDNELALEKVNNSTNSSMDYNEQNIKVEKGNILIYEPGGVHKLLNDQLVKNCKQKIKVPRIIVETQEDFCSDTFWNSKFKIEQLTKHVQKYESFNSFKRSLFIIPHTWIVVRIDGKGFHKFTEMHNFTKPNDIRSLRLMSDCAKLVMRKFPSIILCYGQSDEYSFVFRRYRPNHGENEGYSLISRIVSTFTGAFVHLWNTEFKVEPLKINPTFDARFVQYPTSSSLRDYLSWRQADCHINNMYNTCFWKLIEVKGLTNYEAEKRLKGTFSKDKLEILEGELGLKYNLIETIYRKGTVIYIENERNNPSFRKEHIDLISEDFWNKRPWLLGEELKTTNDCINSTMTNYKKFKYINSFEINDKVEPLQYLAIHLKCINTELSQYYSSIQLTELQKSMNAAAKTVMNGIEGIVLCYGYGNNFNFIFSKQWYLLKRSGFKMLINVVSLFCSSYILNWNTYFDVKLDTSSLPMFEGEIYLLPQDQCLRDYLTYHQHKCHLKNLHFTTLRSLIESSNFDYNLAVKKVNNSTESEKNEILFTLCNINYNNENSMAKKGNIMVFETELISKALNSQPVKKCKLQIKEPRTIIEVQDDFCADTFWNTKYETEQITKHIGKYTLLNCFKKNFFVIPHTWIVVRVDGKGFQEMQDLTKPNDLRFLNLMSDSAKLVMRKFSSIILCYGQNNEYSFVFRRYNHREKEGYSLTSRVVTIFTAAFVHLWNTEFKEISLNVTPAFDASFVLYPTNSSLKDYLNFRQIDCYINNIYNIYLLKLIEVEGLTKFEAIGQLKETLSVDKLESFEKELTLKYNSTEKEIYYMGTIIYKENSKEGIQPKLNMEHIDLFSDNFWDCKQWLLGEEFKVKSESSKHLLPMVD